MVLTRQKKNHTKKSRSHQRRTSKKHNSKRKTLRRKSRKTRGGSLNEQTKEDRKALLITFLINKGSKPWSDKDLYYINNSLNKYAEDGDIAMVALLLDYGADPNNNKSPCGIAAEKGLDRKTTDEEAKKYAEVVQLLLENGANPEQSILSYVATRIQEEEEDTNKLKIFHDLLHYGADPTKVVVNMLGELKNTEVLTALKEDPRTKTYIANNEELCKELSETVERNDCASKISTMTPNDEETREDFYERVCKEYKTAMCNHSLLSKEDDQMIKKILSSRERPDSDEVPEIQGATAHKKRMSQITSAAVFWKRKGPGPVEFQIRTDQNTVKWFTRDELSQSNIIDTNLLEHFEFRESLNNALITALVGEKQKVLSNRKKIIRTFPNMDKYKNECAMTVEQKIKTKANN